MTAETPHLAGRTILVVDDERFSRVLIVGMLSKMGAKVIEATDGLRGLASLDGAGGRDIACVIADFSMPNMNGLELLKTIRIGHNVVPRDLKVVMITANTERRLVGAALALDVDAFLIKPASKAVIGERVRRVFGQDFPLKAPSDYAIVPTGLQRPGRTADAPPLSGPPVMGRAVPLSDVPEGAVAAADVVTRSGVHLIGAGAILSARILQGLRDIQSDDDPIEEIWVAA